SAIDDPLEPPAVQTADGDAVNVTARPDEAVADTVNGDWFNVRLASAPNVIVWSTGGGGGDVPVVNDPSGALGGPTLVPLGAEKWYVVVGDKPVMVWLCEVTGAGSSVVVEPYALVSPNATCDEDGWSVCQDTVADVPVTFEVVTPEMVGATDGTLVGRTISTPTMFQVPFVGAVVLMLTVDSTAPAMPARRWVQKVSPEVV